MREYRATCCGRSNRPEAPRLSARSGRAGGLRATRRGGKVRRLWSLRSVLRRVERLAEAEDAAAAAEAEEPNA